MKLSAISEELRKLAQSRDAGTPTATFDGTTYTIRAGTQAKFRPVADITPTANPSMTPRQQALELWKTEHEAVKALRRQIYAMGSDLCPDVRHRAWKLIAKLERGHKFTTRTEKVWVDTEFQFQTRHTVIGETASLFAKSLGQEPEWGETLKLTDEDLTVLSRTFIIRLP